MNNVLYAISGPRGRHSNLRQVARGIAVDLKVACPAAKIILRNAASDQLPHVREFA